MVAGAGSAAENEAEVATKKAKVAMAEGRANDAKALERQAALHRKRADKQGCADSMNRIFFNRQYAAQGLYAVQFFKNGQWRTVIVDDRIPCYADHKTQRHRPIFGRSRDPDEIWVMIIEKAYAKLHGCYEALNGGDYGACDTYVGGTCVSSFVV